MNKPERVVAALTGKIPDKVPYVLSTVMKGVQERIIGHEITEPTVDPLNITGQIVAPSCQAEVTPLLAVVPEVAGFLGLDSIQIQLLPPIFAVEVVRDGIACVSHGLIDSAEALAKVRMPDPDDEKLMRKIEDMIKRYKGEFAMGARIRLGVSPSLLSMGLENLALFYADEDDTLIKTIEMYTDWSRRLNKNLSEMDFDYFWAFDDIAFTTNMLISPQMWRELYRDNMEKAASIIGKPWIYHSDGNYEAILEDIIGAGASGIHPVEGGSMDTAMLKQKYGDRLCLVGNIDIDYTLSAGTTEEVDAEVLARIRQLGPGGRYIVSDSNSVPDMCLAKNVIAMSRAVEKYRDIY